MLAFKWRLICGDPLRTSYISGGSKLTVCYSIYFPFSTMGKHEIDKIARESDESDETCRDWKKY